MKTLLWISFTLLLSACVVVVDFTNNIFCKRKEKEKRISGNSGNFIGWLLAGSTAPLADNLPVFVGMSLATGPFWGMQRTYASNFSIAYNIGIAYYLTEFGSKFIITPVGELSIGYRIY